MVEILVWRHAKTAPGGAGVNDHERALVAPGRDAATSIGRRLVLEQLIPHVVLCSDARRARETADLAVGEFERAPERFDLPELYHAHADDYLEVVSVYGGAAQRILLVAHNPAVADFVSSVAGRSVEMKTGYLALVESDAARADRLARGSHLELKNVWIPGRNT